MLPAHGALAEVRASLDEERPQLSFKARLDVLRHGLKNDRFVGNVMRVLGRDISQICRLYLAMRCKF